MVKDLTCNSCAGNLSLIENKKLYKCSFCGKLYTEDMELVDLKLAEALRKEKKNNLAKDYLEELSKEDPDEHIYKWEILNCSLSPNLLSDYIASIAYVPSKITMLKRSECYKQFYDNAPEEWQGYVSEIDKYLSVCKRIRELRENSKKQPHFEPNSEIMMKSDRYEQKWKQLIVFIVAAYLIFSLCVGSFGGILISMSAGMIILAREYVVHKIIKQEYTEMLEDEMLLQRVEYDKKKNEEKEEIAKLRQQARELMISVRAKEQEILSAISD